MKMFHEFTKKRTSADFKKEWSYIEQEGVKSLIQQAYNEMQGNTKTNVEDKFGLPYTDTSDFAMLSNTNTKYEIEEGWNLEYFAVTHNNIIVAVFMDKNENERFYRVEIDE